MVNHMEEVAKMLGVKIDEEFKVAYSNGNTSNSNYYFTNNGIYNVDAGRYEGPDMFLNLIFGICTIKRKPWKPVKDDIYWTVLSSEVIRSYMWKNDTIDLLSYKLGNCYKTKEEAEYNYDKWVAFYASDEVLEV